MTRSRARLLLGLSLFHLAVLGSIIPGCDTGPAVSEAVSLTSTVALQRENAVVFVVDVPVEITGSLTGSNVIVDFDGTVTASSAEEAKRAAEAVTITHVSDGDVLRMELKRPNIGQGIAGLAKITLPRGLRLAVSARGTVRVQTMERSIEVEASDDVLVEEVRDSARIITSGSILMSSIVPASSSLEAQAGGSIELALPPAVSAEFQLEVAEGGQILIQHPGLPVPVTPGSTSYFTVVRGGAASVRAVAQGGNITVLAL